ncbi:hypothetical protein GMI70_03900 [Eggerthellaceae bacterium zg-893]|nr:hypothetical protein [Eggerthellaceae bacterium zg-893]
MSVFPDMPSMPIPETQHMLYFVAYSPIVQRLPEKDDSEMANDNDSIISQGEHRAATETGGSSEIQIAISIDQNYVYPALVLMQSLLSSRKPNTCYVLNILVDDNFDDALKDKLLGACEGTDGLSISFLSTKKDYSTAEMKISHITKATFFRLELPSLLPHCDRCLYLDSDLIVCSDLTELYNTDIEQYHVAAVMAFAYYRNKAAIQRKIKELGLEELKNYINAGVLLLNMKKLREDGIESKFEEHLSYGYESQDQDVINAVCADSIKLLPFKYNVMTKYEVLSDTVYESSYLHDLLPESEWDEGRLHPTIIHYADKRKPWSDLSTYMADRWWSVVGELPATLQNEIYSNYIFTSIDSALEQRSQLGQTLSKLRSTRASLNKTKDALGKAKKANCKLKESKAWKIGRLATAPARVARKLVHKN